MCQIELLTEVKKIIIYTETKLIKKTDSRSFATIASWFQNCHEHALQKHMDLQFCFFFDLKMHLSFLEKLVSQKKALTHVNYRAGHISQKQSNRRRTTRKFRSENTIKELCLRLRPWTTKGQKTECPKKSNRKPKILFDKLKSQHKFKMEKFIKR